MTADQVLMHMFARLMSDANTAYVAEALRMLCGDIPTPARTGDLVRIVVALRNRFPDHANLILRLSMEEVA